MAHFARIENGMVTFVTPIMECMTGGCIGPADPDYQLNPEQHVSCGTAVFPETEAIGQAFIASIGLEGEWKQTGYNRNFRGNFAGSGMVYDSTHDAFVTPQPYPSWALDTVTFQWVAPTPYPTDGQLYSWDESSLSWKAI